MAQKPNIEDLASDKYKYGFITNIESETAPIGLNEDIIRLISNKKAEPEWLLNKRLEAFNFWKKMTEPKWAKLYYEKIDYQSLHYYSAPKQKVAPKSLKEVDEKALNKLDNISVIIQGDAEFVAKTEKLLGEMFSDEEMKVNIVSCYNITQDINVPNVVEKYDKLLSTNGVEKINNEKYNVQSSQ